MKTSLSRTIYTCDRCGSQHELGDFGCPPPNGWVNLGDVDASRSIMGNADRGSVRVQDRHLCPACLQSFLRWCEAGQVAPQPDENTDIACATSS